MTPISMAQNVVMTEAVFWDTVAFVALANYRDALHAVAVQSVSGVAARQDRND